MVLRKIGKGMFKLTHQICSTMHFLNLLSHIFLDSFVFKSDWISINGCNEVKLELNLKERSQTLNCPFSTSSKVYYVMIMSEMSWQQSATRIW